MLLNEIFTAWNAREEFSGVFSVTGPEGSLFQRACGLRNRAERLPNEFDTVFAIASGTKLFTALAACKLIDEGTLSLDDRVWDIIPLDLKMIDKNVSVFHLLTHTSGIGDYIDEENQSGYDDILKLYDGCPSFRWTTLPYYLPMFNELPQKFKPGERTGYSNAGFILLGLAIESAAGTEYHHHVKEHIIEPLNLKRTGFYYLNELPGNTALGYTYDEKRNALVSNALFMPIVGGSDGGLFTCAADMDALWRGVFSHKLFSQATLDKFLTPHGEFGLGVYIHEHKGSHAYYTVGGDFGTDFFSCYFPRTQTVATALGNTEMGTFPLMEKLFEAYT